MEDVARCGHDQCNHTEEASDNLVIASTLGCAMFDQWLCKGTVQSSSPECTEIDELGSKASKRRRDGRFRGVTDDIDSRPITSVVLEHRAEDATAKMTAPDKLAPDMFVDPSLICNGASGQCVYHQHGQIYPLDEWAEGATGDYPLPFTLALVPYDTIYDQFLAEGHDASPGGPVVSQIPDGQVQVPNSAMPIPPGLPQTVPSVTYTELTTYTELVLSKVPTTLTTHQEVPVTTRVVVSVAPVPIPEPPLPAPEPPQPTPDEPTHFRGRPSGGSAEFSPTPEDWNSTHPKTCRSGRRWTYSSATAFSGTPRAVRATSPATDSCSSTPARRRPSPEQRRLHRRFQHRWRRLGLGRQERLPHLRVGRLCQHLRQTDC